MDVLEAIRERQMYRGTFLDRKVDRATILKLMEAARWAPSGHNSQPWEFMVIDDNKIIRELVAIAVEGYTDVQKTRQDLKKWVQIWWQWFRWSDEELETAGDGMYMRKMSRALWEEIIAAESVEEIREKLMAMLSPTRGSTKIAESPCLIFTLLNKAKKIPDFSQGVMELASTGAAIQNLRLAVHSSGLAAHELSLLCDLPQTREKIGALLGIPPHCRIISAMRIGYPGEQATNLRTHVRKPVEKLIHWNRY